MPPILIGGKQQGLLNDVTTLYLKLSKLDLSA